MPSEAVDAGDAMARVRWVRVYSRIITDYTSSTTVPCVELSRVLCLKEWRGEISPFVFQPRCQPKNDRKNIILDPGSQESPNRHKITCP